MKKLLTYFFCTLGVIFFAMLCTLAYLWFADPFNLRPLITSFIADEPVIPTLVEETTIPTAPVQDKNTLLSPVQETALEKIGIDPAKLPSEITPEMKTCFTTKLGATRVAEIVNGDAPSPLEAFQTRDCYK
jgi:hypothetical protein